MVTHLELEKGGGSDGSVDADPDLESLKFPLEVLQLAAAFPFPRPTAAATQIGNWIVDSLPSSLEAWSLCETFFENGGYIFVPLRRAQFIEDIFSFFYRSNQRRNADIPRGHRLALLLMIFAIGDMLDLTKPATPTGGKRFYYLARAALSLDTLYDQPTLTVVQTIMMMIIYLSMSDHKESAETVYVLSGVNLKLAMMLGLHRESLKFNTNQPTSTSQSEAHVPRAVEEELRRVIFHEVIHFETWQSLQFGRPSLLHFDHFDCEPPGVMSERDNTIETNHMKGQHWSYGFIRSCLIPVLNYAVAVKPPSYSDVLKLDTVVRTHTIPQHMQISSYEGDGTAQDETISRAAVMLQFSSYSMREIALLYLHRPYFACAMSDYPQDPLTSPFGRSVLASFFSARGIVAKICLLFEKEPALSVRIWIFWSQLFVPCMVMGTIVARSPSCSLAPTALTELDTICELLDKAQEGIRASKLLPLALKVRDKAHTIFGLYFSAHGAVQPEMVDISAELSAIAGTSRASAPSSTSNSPASQPSGSTGSSSAPAPAPAPAPASIHAAPACLPTTQHSTLAKQPTFPVLDWSSFTDPETFSSSISQYYVQPDPYGTDPAWSNDMHLWFGQTSVDPMLASDEMAYPTLELQPSWSDLMTQILESSSAS
ncbi:hypothetical protein K439DRAFT_532906 [Ramaria rubella]|nr:hypothetical protein K439DRAFT_532906 [Ramaria rubella]